MRPRRPETRGNRPGAIGRLHAAARPCAVLAVLLVMAWSGGVAEHGAFASERVPPASLAGIQLSFAPVVRASAPAVVNIATSREPRRRGADLFFDDPFFRFFFEEFGRRPGPRDRPQAALGSGVIVGADGLIVTNHHVVEGADQVSAVLADGRSFEARLVAADARSDLALLRIDPGREPLPALPLGDSDSIEVGDLVLAIGNPFGIGQTVTSGIVSAVARRTPQLESDVAFIQTDAAINPGNSGGALVGLDGSLIGVNTAIFTRGGGSIGLGFAIPANLVRAMIRAVEGGATAFVRPWLGTGAQPVDAGIAAGLGLDRAEGALINRVWPGGPADRAGLRPGDVVRAVDGVAVADPQALGFRLALRAPGETVLLEVERHGERLHLPARLDLPPREPPAAITRLGAGHPLAGITVANLSPGFNAELGLDPFEQGVIVLEVARGSRGQRLGLRPRDVLTAVEGLEIRRIEELDRLLGQRRGPLRIALRRDGRAATLVLA
jgi:Do/DeqQ family serine protease